MLSLMHVQFEFTQADLVDASKRFFNRRNRGRSKVWKSALFSAISAGVIIFFFLRNSPSIGLLLGLVIAGIIILIYPRLEQSRLDGRLRRVVADMMRDPGPYVCEVEIRSEGVWLRQMNKQIIHEWQSLEAIEETADSVYIFTRDGGGVVIRDRAFASEGERRQFIEVARSGLMESRS
jgi:hypothetical protein